MGASILDVLSYVSMTEALQERKPGIPNPWLSANPGFFKRRGQPVVGNVARSTVYYGSRRLARNTRFGAGARRRLQSKGGIQDVVLLHTREEDVFDPYILMQLRSPDSYTRQRGEQELARQIDDAKTELMNLRIGALTSFMTFGAAYFDGDGILLGSSSGAVDTVGWQVPSGNLSTIGGTVTGWNTSSTNIAGQILGLLALARQSTGFELEDTYYGINVPGMLVNNTSLQNFLWRHESMNAEYLLSGQVPKKMLQLNWNPVIGVQYEKNDGTAVTFSNDNIVAFTPKLDSWYDMMEGTYPVPKRVGIETDPNRMLDNLEEVAGMFAYGILTADPGIKVSYGDTFLPWAKNGRAIYIATVT